LFQRTAERPKYLHPYVNLRNIITNTLVLLAFGLTKKPRWILLYDLRDLYTTDSIQRREHTYTKIVYSLESFTLSDAWRLLIL
jgi:hypothetical protein